MKMKIEKFLEIIQQNVEVEIIKRWKYTEYYFDPTKYLVLVDTNKVFGEIVVFNNYEVVFYTEENSIDTFLNNEHDCELKIVQTIV